MTNDVTTETSAVETTWDPNSREIGRAFRLVLGTRRYYLAAGAYFLLALPAAVLMAATTTTFLGPVVATCWLTLMLYYALANAVYPYMTSRSLWQTNPLARATEHLRIDPTGVTSTSDLATLHLTWKALTVAFETDEFFALATRRGPGATTVCVPKAGLTPTDIIAARALITENVGPIH